MPRHFAKPTSSAGGLWGLLRPQPPVPGAGAAPHIMAIIRCPEPTGPPQQYAPPHVISLRPPEPASSAAASSAAQPASSAAAQPAPATWSQPAPAAAAAQPVPVLYLHSRFAQQDSSPPPQPSVAAQYRLDADHADVPDQEQLFEAHFQTMDRSAFEGFDWVPSVVSMDIHHVVRMLSAGIPDPLPFHRGNPVVDIRWLCVGFDRVSGPRSLRFMFALFSHHFAPGVAAPRPVSQGPASIRRCPSSTTARPQ